MKSETATFHDLWELHMAAGRLVNHACAIGSRHLSSGVTRIQFHREVAYYARGIVRAVEDGSKSLEQGLQEIKDEQRSLREQFRFVTWHGLGVVTGALQIAAGAGVCYASAGTLCLMAGIPLMAHGANNTYENGRNLATGRSDTVGPVRKGYHAAASAMGQGNREGNIAYGVVDIGLSVHNFTRYVNKPGAWRLFRYIDSDRIRAYKTMGKTSIGVEVLANGVTLENIREETSQ